MKLTVEGKQITATEFTGTLTLYHNRTPVQSNDTGVFVVDKDGVYFVEDQPCLVIDSLESEKRSRWSDFLGSGFRQELKPYTEIRRKINAIKTLFYKNDYYGADSRI